MLEMDFSQIIVGTNHQVKCTSAESSQIVSFIKHKEKQLKAYGNK